MMPISLLILSQLLLVSYFYLKISIAQLKLERLKEKERVRRNRIENLKIFGEYEIFLACKKLEDKSRNIEHYFENEKPFWIFSKERSDSGYELLAIKDIDAETKEIYLRKIKEIDGKKILYKIIIVYRYEKGEKNPLNYKIRNFKSIEVENYNENSRNI